MGAVLRAVCAQCHDTVSPSVVWWWSGDLSCPVHCGVTPSCQSFRAGHGHELGDRADSGTAALQHAGFCSVGRVSNIPSRCGDLVGSVSATPQGGPWGAVMTWPQRVGTLHFWSSSHVDMVSAWGSSVLAACAVSVLVCRCGP